MEKKKVRKIVLLTLLFIISMCGMIGFMVMFSILDNYEISPLSGNKEYAINEANVQLLKKYSIHAMNDYMDDFNMAALKKTNFRYGVIKNSSLQGLELNDLSNYVVNNFDKNFYEQDLNIYSCYMDEDTIIYDDLTLFGYSYMYNSTDRTETASHTISSYIYNINTQKVYYLTEEGFLFEETARIIGDGEKLSNSYIKNVSSIFKAEDEVKWIDDQVSVSLNNSQYEIKLKDIEILTSLEMQNYEVDDKIYWINNGSICVNEKKDYSNDTYYVISYVANPLDQNCNDLFVTVGKYVSIIFDYFWVALVVMILSVIIFTIGFVYVCVKICLKLLNLVRENFGLITRTVGILLLLFLIELFILAYADADAGVVVFLILEKIIFYPITILAVLQLNRLKRASDKMVAGNLNEEIDNSRLFYDYRKIGENLNSLNAGINAAVEDRMKSERFKTELITNVSHDIKTPLTSIINYVDLMQVEGITDNEKKEYLDILAKQSAKLKKLIEDLIEASKAATGNIKLNPETLDVSVAFTQIIGEYKDKLAENNIDLIITTPNEATNIEADARHLQRIFDNLMTNIYKYALPGTRAFVGLEKKDGVVRMSFRNTSKQILSIDSEELMQRFARGDASRNTEGHGLGLSIANSLTEAMGGRLDLQVDGDLFRVIILFKEIIASQEQI